jgi:signal transduction histidine kinase
VTVRDLRDRRVAEEANRDRAAKQREVERLREMDRFRTQLLNSAAHELHTPLTPIRLQLDLLLAKRDQLSPAQRHSLEVLDRNVGRLIRLVGDVLDAARLDAGRLRLSPQELRVDALLGDVVDSFREAARRHGIELELQAEALATRADPHRVQQVAYNLVHNALKFTPRGGRVAVRAFREDAVAVIEVQDTGVGLSPEQQARLFRPFSQAHEHAPRSHGGSGLGLYISKGIVEQHGGTMRVRSLGPGQGATFTFTLPMTAASLASSAAPPRVPADAPPRIA